MPDPSVIDGGNFGRSAGGEGHGYYDGGSFGTPPLLSAGWFTAAQLPGIQESSHNATPFDVDAVLPVSGRGMWLGWGVVGNWARICERYYEVSVSSGVIINIDTYSKAIGGILVSDGTIEPTYDDLLSLFANYPVSDPGGDYMAELRAHLFCHYKHNTSRSPKRTHMGTETIAIVMPMHGLDGISFSGL